MATLIIRPNGDNEVHLTPFGAGAGNYGHVYEVTEDITNGVEADYIGTTDDYTMANHGSETGDISKITVYAQAAHENESAANNRIYLRCNGYNGGVQYLTISDVLYSQDWTGDPADSNNPWTWAKIDALTAGLYLYGGTWEAKEGTQHDLSLCYQVWVVVTYTPVVSGANLFFANG